MTHTCTKVTVRQRAIRNDKISLYLDYYPAVRHPETMIMSRREYLGIYIYAHPKNEMEREFNNDMLNKAEAIRCIRVQSLINEEFGFLDKHKMKADFLAYFAKMMRTKDQKWKVVYAHFSNFVQGKCTFGEVNVDLCKRFRVYLLNAKQLKHTEHKVSLNSAAGYYSTFRGLLKIAYRDKLLRENINDFLEKIEYEDVKKEYLTLDEVKQLAATPCDIPVLKAASLFSCGSRNMKCPTSSTITMVIKAIRHGIVKITRKHPGPRDFCTCISVQTPHQQPTLHQELFSPI